ncbi:MAG: beta-propeller domain-containing protein, partial [Methanomicrobiaceae archaeon]|nr:beta-propeller domain-containing protein [Methanomicrobiaceae archaeon]
MDDVTKHTLLLLCASLVLVAVIGSGCMGIPATPTLASSELKKFNSTAEIEQYLKDSIAKSQQDGYYPTFVPTVGWSTDSNADGRSAQESGMSIAPPPFPQSVEYSKTNIQVAGVDEPDIIKNDNKYIYTISGQTLAIIDAHPAEDASVVSETEIADIPKDIFVSGSRLVLFSTGTELSGTGSQPADSQIAPVPPYYRPYSPVTHTMIYDIGDREHPRLLKDYTIEGDYVDARMIGSLVYLITREQLT